MFLLKDRSIVDRTIMSNGFLGEHRGEKIVKTSKKMMVLFFSHSIWYRVYKRIMHAVKYHVW